MSKDISEEYIKYTNEEIISLMNTGISPLCIETGFLRVSPFVSTSWTRAESVSQPYIDHMFAGT